MTILKKLINHTINQQNSLLKTSTGHLNSKKFNTQTLFLTNILGCQILNYFIVYTTTLPYNRVNIWELFQGRRPTIVSSWLNTYYYNQSYTLCLLLSQRSLSMNPKSVINVICTNARNILYSFISSSIILFHAHAHLIEVYLKMMHIMLAVMKVLTWKF